MLHATSHPHQSSQMLAARLVSRIGDEAFGDELLTFFASVCGAEYCSVFDLNTQEARTVTLSSVFQGTSRMAQQQASLYLDRQLWQQDPMVAQARAQLDVDPVSVVHTAVRELPNSEYRDLLYCRTNVRDRVLMCVRSDSGLIGLSLLRTEKAGDYSAEDMLQLQEMCGLLMAIIDKHVSVLCVKQAESSALRSLATIENCLSTASTVLSSREEQVCARVLYGMSTTGIALDLGIGEETVMTYRKRAYQRLKIGSQRELLLWYMDAWQAQRSQGGRLRHRLQ